MGIDELCYFSFEDSESTGVVAVKNVTFSGYALYLVAIGCLLDVLSTFFPWSEMGGWHFFLPFSTPLPFGWDIQYLGESFPILVVVVSTRVAAILGVAGLFLLGYVKKRVIPSTIIIASAILSFVSVWFFSQIALPFYLGVHLTLLGGFLNLVGIILENLEVQIVVGKDS